MACTQNVYEDVSLEGLQGFARALSLDIKALKEPVVIYLLGPLGVGKTTFVREFFKVLGYPESASVSSPTFTYLNEYQITSKWYAHLDLYRLPENVSLEDLGVFDARTYAIILIEWPEKKKELRELLPPHVQLEFSFATGEDLGKRAIKMSTFS